MPSRRCANGHIFDDSKDQQCPFCDGSELAADTVVNGTATNRSNSQTVLIGRNNAAAISSKGDNTILIRPPGADPTPEKSASKGEVTGWLVVVEGPGKGRDLRLSYGYNSIGRSSDMAICLDFGSDSDSGISRRDHAFVAYEPKSKTFHLSHGSGKNLVYVNDQFIMTPTQLKAHDLIRIGATALLFVPLCGEQFDWQ